MFENYEGKLIVATKLIEDPMFAGSVIYVFRHNDKGACGAILNSTQVVGHVAVAITENPSDLNINEKINSILSNIDKNSIKINVGGPCRTPGPYFLHAYEEFADVFDYEEKPEYDLGIPSHFDTGSNFEEIGGSAYITDGLYFGTPATLTKIYEAGKVEEKKFRVLVGYSGWNSGQLEREIEKGAWEVFDPSPEIFFNPIELSKLVKQAGGVSPKVLGILPKIPEGFNPQWN